MSAATAAEHTCHGAIFCGQPRAAAERECPACPTPRPLLEVLEEHVAQLRAKRAACNCGGHQTHTRLPACPAAAERTDR